MRPYRKSTLKDVAARAGVSTTTVSLFIGGNESVCSPKTAERIRAAIADLRYTPNSLSRSLRVNATRTIGIHLRGVENIPPGSDVSFIERLARGINSSANEADYALLYCPRSTGDSPGGEVFLDGRIDGLICLASPGDPRPAEIARAGLPVVVLAKPADPDSECGAVFADEADTVNAALTHLWDRGHRRIACLTGPIDRSEVTRLRYDGAISWLTVHGICDPLLISPPLSGIGEIDEILAFWSRLPAPPSALFCVNDEIALSALRSARALGIRIPDDLSLIGVNDTPGGADADLPLTSVDIPAESIGAAAVQTLLRLIGGAPIEACRVSVPVSQVIVRASTEGIAIPLSE